MEMIGKCRDAPVGRLGEMRRRLETQHRCVSTGRTGNFEKVVGTLQCNFSTGAVINIS